MECPGPRSARERLEQRIVSDTDDVLGSAFEPRQVEHPGRGPVMRDHRPDG